ncbi:hypothetical protein AB1Y20_002563 [Prymnesium parvum]|uniref:Uncharacterized protein n=1 Tax=Prymnesium parvum TaxID=97485 RepID=A0AB34JBR8_PRYPA
MIFKLTVRARGSAVHSSSASHDIRVHAGAFFAASYASAALRFSSASRFSSRTRCFSSSAAFFRSSASARFFSSQMRCRSSCSCFSASRLAFLTRSSSSLLARSSAASRARASNSCRARRFFWLSLCFRGGALDEAAPGGRSCRGAHKREVERRQDGKGGKVDLSGFTQIGGKVKADR